MKKLHFSTIVGILLLVLSMSGYSQDKQWASNFGFPGLRGFQTGVYNIASVKAFDTFSDGRVVIAGSFMSAGNSPKSSCIAIWDTTRQSFTGLGLDMTGNGVWIYAVKIIGDSVIYVGGSFSSIGNISAKNFAKYNLNTKKWTAIGTFDQNVNSIVLFDNKLYLGGDFTTVNSIKMKGICTYDFTTAKIDSLKEGLSNGVSPVYVYDMEVMNNELIVGGTFKNVGQTLANSIAAWNGTSWRVFGTGLAYSATQPGKVRNIKISGSTIYACGWFKQVNGVAVKDNMAKYEGGAWASIGDITPLVIPDDVMSLELFQDDVYVSINANSTKIGLYKYHAGTWTKTPIDLQGQPIEKLFNAGKELFMGGNFKTPGEALLRWDGTNYKSFGKGANGIVKAMAKDGDYIYVGGQFTRVGTVKADYIARFNTKTEVWDSLATGTGAFDGYVTTIAINGDSVIVGGTFTKVGGKASSRIAIWLKSKKTWITFADPISGYVSVICPYKTGFFVGGDLGSIKGDYKYGCLAYYNGTTWEDLGKAPTSLVSTLLVKGDSLYLGGGFGFAGGITVYRSAIYTISTKAWDLFAPTNAPEVNTLLSVGNKIFVGGNFANIGATGTAAVGYKELTAPKTFTTNGLGQNGGVNVYSLSNWGDSVVFVGGTLYFGTPQDTGYGIVKYNINTQKLQKMGSGIKASYGDRRTYAQVIGNDGYLYVGGDFTSAGGNGAGFMSRWTLAGTANTDDVAPTAAITYSDADSKVAPGDNVTITATFNEAIADAPKPKISISGAVTLAATEMTKVSGTVYTYSYTVATGNGTATVSLSTGKDLAGNVVVATPTSGSTFTVTATSSSVENVLIEESTMQVYPNPASQTLTLKNESTIVQYELYSVLGVLVDTKKVDAKETQITISQFAEGEYILKVVTEKGISSHLVVIKR